MNTTAWTAIRKADAETGAEQRQTYIYHKHQIYIYILLQPHNKELNENTCLSAATIALDDEFCVCMRAFVRAYVSVCVCVCMRAIVLVYMYIINVELGKFGMDLKNLNHHIECIAVQKSFSNGYPQH